MTIQMIISSRNLLKNSGRNLTQIKKRSIGSNNFSTSTKNQLSNEKRQDLKNSKNDDDDSKLKSRIRTVGIIGDGLMGSGIAQVLAQRGLRVNLIGLNEDSLQNSKMIMTKSLNRIFKKIYPSQDQIDPKRDGNDGEMDKEKIFEDQRKVYVESILRNIEPSTSIESLTNNGEKEDGDGGRRPDLIVEAIIENLDQKRQIFSNLDKILNESSKDCIFCSNTSSLKISDISKIVSDDRKRSFAGLHFFNPVPQMKLVEIIKTPDTSQIVIDQLNLLCKQIGKTPVNCKDTPGFIVNRLLVPYLLESMRMLERGEATAEDIDTAMRLGAGHPMGPIELSDYVGLDTMKFISDGWRKERKDEIDEGLVRKVNVLDRLVESSKFGVKTKEGFYKY